MPPRRSTRRRAKATSEKSTRISKRQAVQSTEEEINDEIDVEEVKIKQEEIDENDNVVDDSERSPEKLKGDKDGTLDDKSRVVAFVKREMDGILEENLNFNGNEAANQNSVEKETPSASDEVVKSLEHLDGISRVQEGGDNEENSDNVMKSPVHMDNCSRDQESGDKEEKGANGVKNDYYNEDNNAIESPGRLNDFYGIQEGGDGEGKSADKREETDNVKDGEHSKGKNVMKSPGQLDKCFRVREDGDEEGKKGDNVENDEDNSVIKSPAHMDDTSGVQEGGAEEGKATCERESIDGVKDKEGNKVNNFMKSPGHADKFIGVQDDGDEEMKSADDMEDGDGEDNKVMESLGYLDDFSRVQEVSNEEGKSACKGENVDCAKDNEVNSGMESTGPAGESIGDQDDDDEELRSADGMEDDGDGEDNKLMESLGHLDECTDVQEGCDEEGNIADDMEDIEDSDDTEEVEDHSLTSSGKQRQQEIHVGHLDECTDVQEGCDEEGNIADDMEDNEDIDDTEEVEDHSLTSSGKQRQQEIHVGHLDECTDVQEGCDEEGNIADDMEDNEDSDDTEEVEDHSLTSSGKQRQLEIHVGLLDECTDVQECCDEEGNIADDMEDNEDSDDTEEVEDHSLTSSGKQRQLAIHVGHLDECTDVQEGCDEEGNIADDMEDNEDSDDTEEVEDHSLTSSGKQRQLAIHVGHLDECTDVQEGCDEEGNIADDMEDNEDSDDTEEVEDHSLTSSGKQRQLAIHVTSVHVKGLVKSWNVKKLEELCKQYGEIVNVWLPRNFGARHKDFGFIAFSSHKSALACVEGINNTQLGGETKVKADLAKTRFRGVMQKKGRWGKQHAKFEEVEAEIKAQVHGDEFKGTRKRGRGIAKEESQAPSLLNSTKEGKPNNHRTGFSEGQNANPVKTACKIKNLPQKSNDRGKRKIEHDYNNRQSKKSRGNAQGRQINRYSAKKPHSKEGNRSISGSKRHQLDMEPHAGYIEPATRKPARHYAGYAEATHWHQGQSHSSYLEHTFQNQSQPSVRYARPGFGRQALPRAGYIEPTAETHGFVANDYSLRRAGGYSGQGNQGSAYVRGSASPPSRAQNYTSYAAYQGFAGVSRYHHSSGAYLPRQQYY